MHIYIMYSLTQLNCWLLLKYVSYVIISCYILTLILMLPYFNYVMRDLAICNSIVNCMERAVA